MTTIYIKIDKYREINRLVADIRAKVSDAKALTKKIEEMKEKEDRELEQWRNDLDDAEKKLAFVEQQLSRLE